MRHCALVEPTGSGRTTTDPANGVRLWPTLLSPVTTSSSARLSALELYWPGRVHRHRVPTGAR
jgi:hypothetical protein